MNDAAFLSWLRQTGSRRCVLVEVVSSQNGTDTQHYLSTLAYNTGPADVPANQHYDPVVSTGISFTEQLALNGQATLSAGDIEIENRNGIRDAWLSRVWMNRPVRVYVGDPAWPRADFQMIFSGVVADIAPKGRDTLALKLRDKLQLLNMPVSEQTLAGTSTNKDAIIPLCFGEVHNITPLLTDAAKLEYQVHPGSIERIIEVRDNGLPVSATPALADGKFTLSANPSGAITASVQGDNAGSYRNTIAQLIRRIVTGYGNPATRFTDADIDLDNFAAFDAAHPQPVGIYLSDRTNVLIVCQMLAGSVGAQIAMSRTGKLQLFQITLPAANPVMDITPRHMLERSLTPTTRTDVVAGVKLGFCQCWTVQAGLLTALPPEHKDLFAQQWLIVNASDQATRDAYRLDVLPTQQDTMLLRRVDAEAEATRQLAMWKVPRTIYEFEAVPELLALRLGQTVRLQADRYGMQSGVNGVVISLSPNWLNGHVKVGVIV